MELVNLVLLAGTIAAAAAYLKAPSREREGLLSLLAVLLAYARYESVLFVLPVGLVIAFGWWRQRRVLLSLGTILAPLLMVASSLHLLDYLGRESAWELSQGAETAFAWSHVADNLPHALVFFFSIDGELANSPLLGALGLFGLLTLPLVLFHRSRRGGRLDPVSLSVAFFAPFLVFQFILILGFHASRLDSPFVSRYALPFYWLLLLAALLLCAHLSSHRFRGWQAALWLSGSAIVFYTLPTNATAMFSQRSFAVNEQRWLEALAEHRLGDDGLWVDRYLVPYAVRGTASLSRETVLRYGPEVFEEVEAAIYPAVYYVERLELEGTEYQPASPLAVAMNERFEMRLEAERSFRPFTLTRVYQLTDLKKGSHE